MAYNKEDLEKESLNNLNIFKSSALQESNTKIINVKNPEDFVSFGKFD